MRTYESDVRHGRRLTRVLEDCLNIFSQDAGEYGFIGLIGGAVTCIVVLILGVIGGPVASLLLVLAAVAGTVITLGTATEAYRRVADNLSPDSGQALVGVMMRLPWLLTPWLPLAGVGGLVAFALSGWGSQLPGTLSQAIAMVVLVGAVIYALQRSMAVPAVVIDRARPRDAAEGASLLFTQMPARVTGALALVLSPAVIFGAIALSAGFGPVSTALAVFFLAGLSPLAAIVLAEMYDEAARSVAPADRAHHAGRALAAKRRQGAR